MIRILIVDSREAADGLAVQLRDRGFDVRVASTWPEAEAAAQADRPDVAIIDPVDDLLCFADRWRGRLTLVAWPSSVTKEDRECMTDAGIFFCVPKAAGPALLLDLLYAFQHTLIR